MVRNNQNICIGDEICFNQCVVLIVTAWFKVSMAEDNKTDEELKENTPPDADFTLGYDC